MTQKSIESYTYDKPLSLDKPQWSVDSQAIAWTPGSFGASEIPAGVYQPIIPWEKPPYLHRIKFSTDTLVDMPDDPSSIVLTHILDFWNKEDSFRELGITYKRGIILYGPPGSGKSVTIYRLASMLEQHAAVMLLAKSSSTARVGIELVKTLEKNRKIVVIFEDIDGIIRREGDEDLTHLLDGGADVDNVLFIATTNYPERIPERILARPSRFDVVMRIGMPSEAARRAYINSLIKNNLLVDVEQLVTVTDGLSIAAIKEVVILIVIFEYTIQEAVEKVRTAAILEKE